MAAPLKKHNVFIFHLTAVFKWDNFFKYDRLNKNFNKKMSLA
jgi:hypothetical protein